MSFDFLTSAFELQTSTMGRGFLISWLVCFQGVGCSESSSLDASTSDAATSVDAGQRRDAGDVGVSTAEVAFSALEGASYHLYRATLDGQRLRRIADLGGSQLAPRWSPDGERILFVSTHSGGSQAYVLDLETGATSSVAAGFLRTASPDWSPDGTEIVFEGTATASDTPSLYLVDARGDVDVLVQDSARNAGPIFTPDGEAVIFASDRDGPFDLYRIRLGTRQIDRLTTGSAVLGRPTIAADGCTIALAREQLQSTVIVALDICRPDARVVILSAEGDSEPSYQRTGRFLTFTTTRFGGTSVMLWDLELGGPPTPVSTGLPMVGNADVGPP